MVLFGRKLIQGVDVNRAIAYGRSLVEEVGEEPVLGYLGDSCASQVADALLEPNHATGIVGMFKDPEEGFVYLFARRVLDLIQAFIDPLKVLKGPSSFTPRDSHFRLLG